jgi:hypothetical protein
MCAINNKLKKNIKNKKLHCKQLKHKDIANCKSKTRKKMASNPKLQRQAPTLIENSFKSYKSYILKP